MQAIIRRMKLRLPQAEVAARTQWSIEEAFRLSGQDGGQRLVVIRKLVLGRLTPELNALIDRRLKELIGNAVHADHPGSANAEAVYFDTPEAASCLLLKRLITGIEPVEWFWPQAVPQWTQSSPHAVSELLENLTATPQGRIQLARAVVALLREQHHVLLLETVTQELARKLLTIWPGPDIVSKLELKPGQAAFEVRQDASTRARLFQVISRWHSSDPRHVWWVTIAQIAASPHLAANASSLLSFSRDATGQKPNSMPPTGNNIRFLNRAIRPMEKSIKYAPRTKQHPDEVDARAVEEDTANTSTTQPARLCNLPVAEERSGAAGLFLLVRPLHYLGFERWLEQHPQEAAQGYGWMLLRAIAERHRVPETDPIWQRLPQMPDQAADTTAWRVALDRLLRRRCHSKLATIMKRAGWLSGSDAALTIRFTENTADVKLRRMAFDVNPGFVSWLGLDLAYQYQDRTTQ